MLDLPDNASIDHLRQQAKDLLVVLRRDDPGASLSAAQLTIARKHGYDSWAELKAEVDRLRSRPPLVAPDERAVAVAAAYDLGAVESAMTHVGLEWAGGVWDLVTDRGRFVVTELQRYVVPAHIDLQAELVEQAIAAGVVAPVPVRGPDGRCALEVDGAAWQVHRWMPLGPTPPQPPPADLAVEAGRALAVIHGLRLPPPAPVVDWLTHRWSEDEWLGVVAQARNAGCDWADDLERAVPGFVALDSILDRDDPNPRAIFTKAWHAPSGSRVLAGRRLALVGWEHSGAVPMDWDVAAAVCAWSETVEGGYDLVAAKAFLVGYRDAGGEVDLRPESFSCGVTAGLNWTISRANVASGSCDEQERALADRAIRTIVRDPLRLETVQALVDATAC